MRGTATVSYTHLKLFLEQGYKKTTVAQIVHEAGVSNSTFQKIFRAKDGVLTELVEFMFGNQFAMARQTAGQTLPPIYVYAVETAIQMTLTELNENLREIYLEAYTQNEASEYIFLSLIHIYVIFHRVRVKAPNLGKKRFLGKIIAPRLEQKAHHVKLPGRQADTVFPAHKRAGGKVEGGIAECQLVDLRTLTAQKCVCLLYTSRRSVSKEPPPPGRLWEISVFHPQAGPRCTFRRW